MALPIIPKELIAPLTDAEFNPPLARISTKYDRLFAITII